MGLDVTALRQVRYLGTDGDEDDMYENGFVHAYVNDDFAGRADGRKSGYYEAADRLDFRAGSYSTYNMFREALAQMALGISAEIVWLNGERYRDAPFYELIQFADNEGIIGPAPAKRLAEAFAAHDAQARASWGEDSYYYLTYRRFRQGFEMAADDGLLDFC